MKKCFEVTIKALRLTDGGLQKKVTEKYLFDALSFTEGESEAIKNLSPYVDGEFEVVDINIRKFDEVHLTNDEKAEGYYKVTIELVTLNVNTNAEKKTRAAMLVQAVDFDDAYKRFKDIMASSIMDFNVKSMTITPYIDVFETKETPKLFF